MDTGLSKKKTFDPWLVFFLVFIGTDIYSFKWGTFTLRFIQVALLACFLWRLARNELRFDLKILLGTGLWIGASALALSFSSHVVRSFAYWMWIVYSATVVLFLFYDFARRLDGEVLHKSIRIALWILGFLVLLSFGLGLRKIALPFFGYQDQGSFLRPALWFYEPSYLATYLAFYFAYFLYAYLKVPEKGSLIDLLLSLLTVLVITSTSGFLALVIAVGLVVIMPSMWSGRLLKLLALLAGIGGLLLGGLYLVRPRIVELLIGRIFSQGISGASQGRVDRWFETWDFFTRNPIFGLGPGIYHPVVGDSVLPPSNVSLDMLSTLGMVGTLAFLVLLLCVFLPNGHVRLRDKDKSDADFFRYKALGFGFLVFMLTLQANPTFLRLYLWMFLGLAGGALARLEHRDESPQVLKAET